MEGNIRKTILRYSMNVCKLFFARSEKRSVTILIYIALIAVSAVITYNLKHHFSNQGPASKFSVFDDNKKEELNPSKVIVSSKQISSPGVVSEEAFNPKFHLPTVCNSFEVEVNKKNKIPEIQKDKICFPKKVPLGQQVILLPGNCRAKTKQNLVNNHVYFGPEDETLLELDKTCSSRSGFHFGVFTKRTSLDFEHLSLPASLKSPEPINPEVIAQALKSKWSYENENELSRWSNNLKKATFLKPFSNEEIVLIFIPRPKDLKTALTSGALLIYKKSHAEVLSCPYSLKDQKFFKLEGEYFLEVSGSSCEWGGSTDEIFQFDKKNKKFKLIFSHINEWC